MWGEIYGSFRYRIGNATTGEIIQEGRAVEYITTAKEQAAATVVSTDGTHGRVVCVIEQKEHKKWVEVMRRSWDFPDWEKIDLVRYRIDGVLGYYSIVMAESSDTAQVFYHPDMDDYGIEREDITDDCFIEYIPDEILRHAFLSGVWETSHRGHSHSEDILML